MDATLKSKWVEALRSGTYGQTTGKLHDMQEGGFCCLGVLCKVMGAEFGPSTIEDDGYGNYEHVPVLNGRLLSAGEGEELSSLFCKEIGIPDQHDLIALNDGHSPKDGPEIRKHTFPEIADYIEKNL